MITLQRPRASLIQIALGLAMVLVVAGCAQMRSEPTPTPEPVTLRFAFPQRTKEQKYWEAAQAFKAKYPNITVEVARTGDMVRRVMSGDVDVFEAEQFDFPVLLQRAAIRDLTPYLESESGFPASDYAPKLMDVFREQGRTWGLPANLDPIVLFYNKSLCDQRNAPYPQIGWDWQDFLATASALSDPDTLPQKYGFWPDPYGLGVWAFVYQGGGQVVDNLIQPTRATLDDPLVVRAVEWYASLANEHQVMPLISAMSTDMWRATWNAIDRQETGMWTVLLSERGGRNRQSTWPFEWGVVPLPRDQSRVTFVMATGYFVSARAAHPRESWLWLDFLATEADLDWDVPPRRSTAQSEAYRQRVGDQVYAVAQETMEYGMTLPAAVWLTQVPMQSMDLLDQILQGKIEAQEGLVEMQRQWDAAIRSMNE